MRRYAIARSFHRLIMMPCYVSSICLLEIIHNERDFFVVSIISSSSSFSSLKSDKQTQIMCQSQLLSSDDDTVVKPVEEAGRVTRQVSTATAAMQFMGNNLSGSG
jgi:hypothetical protein